MTELTNNPAILNEINSNLVKLQQLQAENNQLLAALIQGICHMFSCENKNEKTISIPLLQTSKTLGLSSM
jgi:hypothetical protein